MKWTTKRPTQPGWYWVRTPGGAGTILQLYYAHGELYYWFDKPSKHPRAVTAVSVADARTQWAGPIPEPEEDPA
jgi:hypothetical protein